MSSTIANASTGHLAMDHTNCTVGPRPSDSPMASLTGPEIAMKCAHMSRYTIPLSLSERDRG
ncbi:hypothetical protein, partial [Clavibacter michiganensis]|uniref:hypothetical protein n=1 Tax=Clavibacter michiganensis TaxID=28447 RepID=UPI00292E7570